MKTPIRKKWPHKSQFFAIRKVSSSELMLTRLVYKINFLKHLPLMLGVYVFITFQPTKKKCPHAFLSRFDTGTAPEVQQVLPGILCLFKLAAIGKDHTPFFGL